MPAKLLPLPDLELVMLSMILWAMEYFCDQLRSTVPTVSPPNPLSTSSQPAGVQREGPEAVQAFLSNCQSTNELSSSAKHSSAQATIK